MSDRLRPLLLLAVVSTVAPAALAQKGQPFHLPADCKTVFDDIAVQHKIDAQCGDAGDTPSTEAPHQEQNRRKNEFCVTGTPRDVTFAELTELQEKADAAFAKLGVTYDREHLPADRSPLRDLGEGTLARLVGLVHDARYSNVKSGGESVNCHESFNSWNDIHVDLAEGQGAKSCEHLTAEVSPHFRPKRWTPARIMRSGRPIRITGPLFFDASHHPCKNGKPVHDQARASNWEIHPAYDLEICKHASLEQCTVDDDSAWERLQ